MVLRTALSTHPNAMKMVMVHASEPIGADRSHRRSEISKDFVAGVMRDALANVKDLPWDKQTVRGRGTYRFEVSRSKSLSVSHSRRDRILFYATIFSIHYFLCNIQNACSELLVVDTLLCKSMIPHCS